MPGAVKSLYQLADKYFVPRDEIALWLQNHLKELRYNYHIPSHDMEMFKDVLEHVETTHNEKGKRLMIDAAPIKKEEEMSSFGKTVTLTLRVLV